MMKLTHRLFIIVSVYRLVSFIHNAPFYSFS